MGTSKSGRYLNTRGSGHSVSDFALVHSSEGKFNNVSKNGRKIRLVSGGHGQAGMNILDKYHIEYNVTKTYPNGVRIGNIPSHKNKKKAFENGQVWFPKSWSNKDIKHAGEHVASLKNNNHASDGKAVYGMWKGVRVGVIRTNGKIATVFPDIKQPTGRKK